MNRRDPDYFVATQWFMTTNLRPDAADRALSGGEPYARDRVSRPDECVTIVTKNPARVLQFS